MHRFIRLTRATTFVAATAWSLAFAPPVTAQEADNVESLVQAPAETLERDPSRPIIPDAIREQLERKHAENEAKADRLNEEARERLDQRNQKSEERRREDEARWEQRKAERQAKRERSIAETQARTEAGAERLRYGLEKLTSKNEVLKADWDSLNEEEQREFRAKCQADFAQRMAEAKKQGEILIALCTMGFGALGGMSSMFSGVAGVELAGGAATEAGTAVAGEAMVAEAGAGAAVGTAEGALSGAEIAESAGLDMAGSSGSAAGVFNPSAALEVPKGSRLAALEGGPNYGKLISDALKAGKTGGSSEIARGGGFFRPSLRPAPPRPPVRPYPTGRDPRRSDPFFDRLNNSVRPPLPDLRELHENSLEKKTADFADGVQARLKTWNWLQGFTPREFQCTIPPQGWHPPLLWPPLPQGPYNGSSFMKGTNPPHGPARFKYRELGPEGFDVYEQDGQEFVVPLD